MNYIGDHYVAPWELMRTGAMENRGEIVEDGTVKGMPSSGHGPPRNVANGTT